MSLFTRGSAPARARAAAVLALATWTACSGGGAPTAPARAPSAARQGRPPSVLLVTIDTWRWDHVGASGEGKVETPQLDRLAAEGTYVRRVQSPCPLTTPAHATILTGLPPLGHGIRDNRHFALKPGVTTIAQRFKESGFRTGAVISGAPLRRTYGLDRGFDHYDDQGLGVEGDNAITPSSRPAEATTARALGWIGEQPPDARLFLWVHYYDPHEPYLPPPPFAERYAGRPYAGEVAHVDAALAPLLDRVRSDPSRPWIVAVTGDHGEGLGDHGERTHGILLYGSTTEVPLILWPARGTAARAALGLVDVAPTLCELAGVGPPSGHGVSVYSGPEGDRWLLGETMYPALGYGLSPALLLRRGRLVYLDHGSPEIYDLDADPREATDLATTDRGRAFAQEAIEEKERLLGDGWAAGGPALSLSREEAAALRSLGYVEGPRPGRGAPRKTDLRRFASELARLDEARKLLSARRWKEALAAYDAFLAGFPDSPMAHQERGQVLAATGDAAGAARAFGRALALDPADAISALDLGNLAAARGDAAAAESFFRRSLAIEEGQAEAHLNLGLLYLHHLHRPKEAKPHLERFLELAPDDRDAPEARRLAEGIR